MAGGESSKIKIILDLRFRGDDRENFKMKSIVPFAILFFAVILQATLFKYIGSAGVFLNFVLVLLLYSVFYGKRFKMTMFAAFLAGFLLDGLSGLPFGYLTFAVPAVVFLARAILSLVLGDSFWRFVFFVALGTALYDVVLLITLFLARKITVAGMDFSAFGSALAIELALNIIAALMLYPLRKWIIL